MKKTFDEIVLFARTGLNPRQNFKLGQGNNNYITIKNIKNNSLVIDNNTDVVDDEAIKLIHKRSQIKKGDILFASIGRMGDMYIIDDEPEGWDINESVFAFTLDTGIIRQKYFYYIFRLKSTLDYLVSNSSGSTFKSIKMNQLKKMVFDIPALEEQDQIVEALDKVCNVIELRKQELSALDNLIKARFVELFGEDIKQSNMTIADIAEETTVGIANSATHAYSESGVVMLRNQNIRSNYLDDRDLIYIKQVFAEKYRNKALHEGDILVTRTGANVGMACIVPKKYEGCQTFTTLILRLRKDICISPIFVCHYINSPLGKSFVDGNKIGGGQPNFGAKQLATMPIVVPSKEKQIAFDSFVKQVDKSKVVVQKALDETQLLFDSLMQEYFG